MFCGHLDGLPEAALQRHELRQLRRPRRGVARARQVLRRGGVRHAQGFVLARQRRAVALGRGQPRRRIARAGAELLQRRDARAQRVRRRGVLLGQARELGRVQLAQRGERRTVLSS